MDKRVLIYISATRQVTTAVWHLEPIGFTDKSVAILSEIPDLKPFEGFSNVSIKFYDRERKAEFCFSDDDRLVQKDCYNLDFWVKGNNKESEGKTMTHNVTITKEENRVIEEYWVIKAYRNLNPPTKELTVSKESKTEPTYQEIAQFLSDTNAKSAWVEHNYRFEPDLPFF